MASLRFSKRLELTVLSFWFYSKTQTFQFSDAELFLKSELAVIDKIKYPPITGNKPETISSGKDIFVKPKSTSTQVM